MRLATLRIDGRTVAARIDPSGYVVIEGAADLNELVEDPDWVGRARRAEGSSLPLDSPLSLPFPSPRKVICVGLNYREHILEMGRELPEYPTLFAKFADTLTGPGESITIPPEDPSTDWEGELAVVIGKPASKISPDDAHSHIAGYTIANDISMRGFQNRTPEWLQGKIWARSTPLGPVMVTADELNFEDAKLTTRVNGDMVQQHVLADMMFPPAQLLSYISTIIPLHPGDIILTGTPGGIGHGRKPPVYLQPEDRVDVSIDGIGTLSNVMK